MGHNDRRRWLEAGDGFERAASGGKTWRVRPVGPGWRLDLIDPAAVNWLGGPRGSTALPTWDAASREACVGMVGHIERHEAYAAQASKVEGSLIAPTRLPGITIHATRTGTTIYAAAKDDGTGKEVGMYRADLSNWTTAWVLGEPTFDGGYSVRPHLIGKGIGRALFEAVEELAGVALTPHGRYGAVGGQSSYSLAFWEKRAKHRRVPGLDDPAVAERDAERVRVRMILSTASDILFARDPLLIAAMACATGWDVVHVRPEDGSDIREAWCLGPDGVPLSGLGPDDGIQNARKGSSEGGAPAAVRTDAATYLATVEAALLGGRRGFEEAGEHRAYMAQLSHAASTVLERYAGVTASPEDLKAWILGAADGMLHTAIRQGDPEPAQERDGNDAPAGPRP